MGILNIFKSKEKVDNGKVKLMKVKDLKILEFNEFRVDNDLSELMRSIKQNGLLHPISVRKSDNAVICGNRRLASCIKLGYITIRCIIKDVDDETLYILNLTENLSRKDITPFEIGKICYELKTGVLCERKLTTLEMATRLGLSEVRIKNCIFAYTDMPKTEIKHFPVGTTKRTDEDVIPESLLTELRSLYENKKITDGEFKKLISIVKSKKTTRIKLKKLAQLIRRGLDFEVVIKDIDNYKPQNIMFIFNEKERKKLVLKKKKQVSGIIKDLIKAKYPNLIF